ncbi:MAG: SHOCT domain-containing protein, partial [Actinomycetes bacterium]|nr:SHOCT domain-containing protein [Actinomycetes bacterium]MDX5450664.1 SHOCT domain-containing protein [Actinomycetes bacterium]
PRAGRTSHAGRASHAGRSGRTHGPSSATSVTPPVDAALAILRERFARGEIDEAQFRAMAAVLADVTDTPG